MATLCFCRQVFHQSFRRHHFAALINKTIKITTNSNLTNIYYKNIGNRSSKVSPGYSPCFVPYSIEPVINIQRRQFHVLSTTNKINSNDVLLKNVNLPVLHRPKKHMHSLLYSIQCSTPVHYMMELLKYVHDTTSLPWWGVIILTGLALRITLTFPVAVYQLYINMKLANIEKTVEGMLPKIDKEINIKRVLGRWTRDHTAKMHKKEREAIFYELMLRDNCHWAKTVLIYVTQIPLWVTLSFSIRNLCDMTPIPNSTAREIYIQLCNEGFGWMTNLTEVDPYYIFPVGTGLVNLLLVEVMILKHGERAKRRYLLNQFRRVICVLFVPIIAIASPSSLVLYWFASSTTALIQWLVILHPKVTYVFGIKNKDLHPYKDLWSKAQLKYLKK